MEEEDAVKVYPTFTSVRKNFFYHYRRPDGQLDYYGNHRITYMDKTMCFVFPKQSIVDHTLVVHLNGYTAAYTLSDEDNNRLRTRRQCFGRPRVEGEEAVADFNLGHSGDYAFRTSQWGNNNTWRWNLYFGFGLPVKTDGNELSSNFWSPSWNWGVRLLRAFSKVYCLGVGLGHEHTYYRFNSDSATPNALESNYPIITSLLPAMDDIDVRRVSFSEWTLELFQRVRLKSLGLFSNGLQWDLGVYGSLGTTHYELEGDAPAGAGMDDLELHFGGLDALDDYTLNVGVTTRLTYDIIGLYVRYRLNGLGKDPASGKVLLPRLTLGLQLQL